MNASPANPGSGKPADRSTLVQAAVALGVTALLLRACHTEGTLLKVPRMLSLLWTLAAFGGVGWWLRLKGAQAERPAWPNLAAPLILLTAMVAYLYSSATSQEWFYVSGWVPKSGWWTRMFDSWPGRFCFLGFVLTPLFLMARRWVPRLLGAGLLLGQFVLLVTFFQATGGDPLYGDDHSSFIHRLDIISRVFPGISYYDPFWNGGRSAIFTVASGSMGLGALFLPLLKTGSAMTLYTPVLAIFFIVLMPWGAVWAVRLVGGSWTAALAGGFLGLGVTRYFFLWLLHFGTIGASSAAAATPLVLAGLYRVVWMERRGWKEILLLGCSAFFFVNWPGNIFMVVPIVLAVLLSRPTWSWPAIKPLAGAGLVAALLGLPLAAAVILHADVGHFAEDVHAAMPFLETLETGYRRLTSHFRQAHPLLLWLGVGGFWAVRRRGFAFFFGIVLVGFAFLAGWGENWKPQFQLSRAGIPLFFAAVLPAALLVGRLLRQRSWWLAPVQGVVMAALALAVVSTQQAYANRMPATYRVLNQETRDYIAWIRQNVPEGQRLLFAGPAVHAYGGGHVAPLPFATGREMMAVDYYHFSPKKVRYRFPDDPFRGTAEKVYLYFQYYNVGYVSTHSPGWMKHFEDHPQFYEEARSFGEGVAKKVFRVKHPTTPFVASSGKVTSAMNRLVVRLDDPDAEAVIRYNWVEGLEPAGRATIRPYDMGMGVTFIAIDPNGEEEVVLNYRRWP